MRNIYKISILKTMMLFVFGFLLHTKTLAQIDITIGTGTVGNTGTTYPCPLQDWFEGGRSQYLYLASELSAAGMGPGNITALKWTVTNLNTFTGAVEKFSIRVGSTIIGTLSATAWEPGTVQVRAQADYVPVVGVNTFTFSSSFFWNGTDNLIIEICNGEPGNAVGTWFTNNPTVTWTTGLAFNGSHNYRADNLDNLCGTATTANIGTQTTRPNVILSWIPATACSATPTGGTTVANPTIVCFGLPFDLTVTGASVASGLTYQWESSTNNITYTAIAGATNPSLNTTQAASTWYRRRTTCTSSGLFANSTPVQVISPVLVGGTFTINSAVATGGTNFASFNDAYNYIKCGINAPVIFNVDPASGPYTEQLNMIAVPGASATNTVTFNGNGRTLQFNSTNTNERAVIKLNGASHIRFNNLTIAATGTLTTEYGFGVQLLNNADSNLVNNCTININKTSTATNYAGIVMNASATGATTTGNTLCDANTFSNNTINGGYYGITMVGSTTQSVARNKVTNNKFFDQHLYGMYLLGNFDALIEGNEIARPTTTISPALGYGIFVTSLNTKVIINKNRIHSSFEAQQTSVNDYYGIMHTGVDALATLENVVSNNAIYNIKSNGTIYGINNTSSDNIWYYHNTIALDHTASTSTEATRGFFQTTLAGGIEFRNNLVTLTRGGTGAKHAIYMATNTTGYISNNNNFYLTPGATTFTGFFNANQATLANWQTASGKDANSINTDPVYANVAASNFAPTNASMNNLGADLTANYTVNDDIVNNPRIVASPDMGAWEFSPGACVAPPTPGTSITSIIGPVCPNTLGTFNLTGNSFGLNQTYEWEFSTTLAGPYTSISAALTNPTLNYTVTQTGYFRCKVTCSGNSVSSTPVLVNVNLILAAGSYTINNTAPLSATNFPSFNAAYQAMKCGIGGPIVLNVVAGTGPYNEQLLMDSIQNASAINTITWNGNGRTISFISTNTNDRGVIRLNGVKHMIFDSLVVNSLGTLTTEYGHGFHLQNNADSNTVKNCTINLNATLTSTNYAGIVISGGATATTTTTNNCDRNLLQNNTIIGGYYGISLASLAANPSVGTRMINNKIKDYYLYGIYHSTANNSLIEGNELSMPTRINAGTNYGIYSIGVVSKLGISKNRVFDINKLNPTGTNISYGIFCTSDATAGNEIVISNNAVYNWKGQGTHYGINVGSDFANIYHNTVNFDDQTSTGTASTFCLNYNLASASNNIRDNMFSITKSGNATKFGIYFQTTPTNYISNNNNIFINTTNGHVGFNGANRTTLANWQAASGQDANSFAISPFYSSVATGNLSPLNPVLDNKGAPVGITTDISNAARSATTPDIGAWEFAVPPCVAPPVVSTAVAVPNSAICLGTDIKLSITGMVYGANQTYQWQTATALAGPYTNLSGVMQFPDTTVLATTTLYYRCVVTCAGQSTPSNPALVSLNPAFLAGTYTINATLPPSATNFISFNSAVAALYCGITGHVIFNVAANTYTEQVRIGVVPGMGPNATVTFQSANGDPAAAILTFASTLAGVNYTLKLDSSKYFIFNALTINGTNTTTGRVIELANTASFNTIRNCRINTPVSTSTTTNVVGIFSSSLYGAGTNKIVSNTITGGMSGIYMTALNAANKSLNNIIDSNTVNGSYVNNIYVQNMDFVKVRNNTANITNPRNTNAYGIYIFDCDSAMEVSKNTVNINTVTGTFYGMYFNSNASVLASPGLIASNTVLAATANTGTGYGMYQTGSLASKFVNNVVSLNTSSAGAYGLYHTTGSVEYTNNTINNYNNATTATTSYAAYLNQTAGAQTLVRNNIFAHNNNGRAIYMANANFIYSDYNMLYTNGTVLATFNLGAIPNLKKWIDTTGWDYHSIQYKPSFVSNTNLQPDLANPEVWGIHGRGVQIAGNNADFNGNVRPVTLAAGVPDLGAYEFVPTSVPVMLVATPAAPAPNTTQKFSLGTDTVSIIKWGATVPATITGKRYTGTIPPGLAPAQQYMYFYTDFDVPSGSYNYEMQQNYMDPWRGIIPNEPIIKLGRTNAANAWIVSTNSTVSILDNNIKEPNLSFIDKYTGLTDGIAAPPAIDPIVLDTASFGTRFWVGYGHHQFFPGTNTQQMVLYLGARQTPANVTVRINGTPWVKNYTIPANTVLTSDIITKSGLFDARLLNEGFSERGISINSDVPIVAYAHIYGSAASGATMLLPVGTYGYEYYSTNFRQNYAADCYSWFYVVADRDSTFIEITPSNPSRAGLPANVPFVVKLNKGEIYQVLGAINSGSNGFDLTGSKAKAIPNNQGKCLPFAMFSGSSRTAIYCSGLNSTGNGDNLIQQNFPSQAWGRSYLTAPTSNASAANSLHTNIFRVVVKDPTTVVTRNGVVLTGLVNNRFYEFDANTADLIVADKPVMVAQYMASSGSNCANTAGNGDPEMFYISPIEQGIKNVALFRNTQQGITLNYVTLIIPTGGVPSLRIDGTAVFDYTYVHPNIAGYTVVVKRWTAAQAQTTIVSDSAFTAITYGLGSVESYGYNAGTLVKNLNAVSAISNTLGSGGNSPYTCVGTPFRFKVLLSVQPTQLTWQFSQVANLTPNANVIQNNPVSTGTQIINGNTYYEYTINQDYQFTAPGSYIVPVNLVHPSFESCNSSLDITVSVTVLPEPVTDFSVVYSGCVGDVAQFNGTATQNTTATTNSWAWNFGDATTAAIQNPTKTYSNPGTYNVQLRVVGTDGCLGDTTKPVIVNPRPVVSLVSDSLSICINANATFTVQNPVAGATYNWYNAATGGSLVGTGTTYTIANVGVNTQVWVEGVVNGCNSIVRRRAIVTVLPLLTPPVASIDVVGVNFIQWKWLPVPNALTYDVSQNNGSSWTVPSSGATGLLHRITGLNPLTSVTLLVRANGGCLPSISLPVTGKTLTDQLYFPNSFTPNGDGLNDFWRVYGYIIKDLRIMIFNQWGENIFESRNQSTGWDGKFKGKIQPAGVYMYVVDLTLNDGTKQTQKGSINLLH